MNTKQFLDKITKNWPAKIVCFVLAMLIYFFHQSSTYDKKTFTVPLTVVENGSMTVVSGMERNKYIKVTVRGKSEQLAGITEKELKAYVDVSGQTKEGTAIYPIMIEPDERVLLMEPLEISSKPESVELKLEKHIFRYVPVAATLSGSPAYGYEQVSIIPDPKNVRISGPRSMVDSVDSIPTGPVEIEGATDTVKASVKLVNQNKLISLDENPEIAVTVSIAAQGSSVDYTGINISLENVAEDLTLIPAVKSVDVSLEGDRLTMEGLSRDSILAFADCTLVTEEGDYSVPVFVLAPDSCKIVTQSVDFIDVTAVHREITEEDEVSAEAEEGETSEDAGETTQSDVETTPVVEEESAAVQPEENGSDNAAEESQ